MATFAEALYSLSAERLRQLVQWRGVEPKKLSMMPDKRQLVQFLANDLNRQQSVVHAILRCDARELRLLQLIVSYETGRPFTWSALVDMAGGAALESALAAVMTHLEEMGLAFRVGDKIFVPEGVRYQVPASLSDRHTLIRLLNAYDAPSLKRIMEKLGLEVEHGTKNNHVEKIRQHLLESGTPIPLKTPLTAEERDVLEYLVQAGGSATPIEVATAVLDRHVDDFFRYEWQNRWKQGKERNAIDSLLARGLIYIATSGYGYNFFLLIPGDLLRALIGNQNAGFWTDAPPQLEPLDSPPAMVTRQSNLVRDVVGLLGFFAAQEAVRTNTGHVHKASLKNAARTLSLPEERYAAFLYALCREAGLIAPQGEKQIYALTSKGNSWLHWDSRAQTRALYEAWRDGVTWGEMYAEPLIKSNDYRHKDTILPIRNSVLELLAKSEDSTAFFSIDSVVTALTFHSPLLLSQQTAFGGGLVSSPAIFVRLLIGECLYWLGLVEIGREAGDATGPKPQEMATALGRVVRGEPALKAAGPEITGFHLTPLGDYLLGKEGAQPPPEEPREDKFIVQANAEIFVSPYLDPLTLYHLLTITETPAKGATGNTVCLTKEAIRRAFDQGETPKDLIAFLQAHSRTGIPQNVEYLINEVGGKHGHIRLGKAQMYLQVDSPLLLKELQARRELKDHFVRNLTETVAILKSDDLDKMLRDLRKAGYLPVSDEAAANAFGGRARPAPSSPPTPPAVDKKQAAKAAKAETAVDWERIAREDGKPWNDKTAATQSLSKPAGAQDNKNLIRVLLSNASVVRQVVEVLYQTPGQGATLYRLEPHSFSGDAIRGYSQGEDEEVLLNLNLIHWAKLTSERF